MKVILILSVFLSASSLAAEVRCPENFLIHLYDFNEHERMKEEGKKAGVGTAFDHVLESGYLEVLSEIEKNPEVVNCKDENGQTPLSYSLNIKRNYCPYLKAARFLLEKGAAVNQIEECAMQTPLFYAVHAYGSIFGHSSLTHYQNKECLKEITESETRGMVQTLLSRGANPDLETYTIESVRSVAREAKVSFLLQ